MTAERLMLRDLAEAAATHKSIEMAVTSAIKTALPTVIEEILSQKYGGQEITIYVAKRSASSRRDRDNAIRAKFNGRNAQILATEFKMSVRQIMRICCPPRKL